MYAVIEQDYFGHKSLFECCKEQDAVKWMQGLEETYGKRFKIIQK